jgi:hypothetical protein
VWGKKKVFLLHFAPCAKKKNYEKLVQDTKTGLTQLSQLMVGA